MDNVQSVIKDIKDAKHRDAHIKNTMHDKRMLHGGFVGQSEGSFLHP